MAINTRFKVSHGYVFAESTYCRVRRKAQAASLSPRMPRRRSPVGRTTSATPRCRRGSTPACRRRRSPSGQGTASPCCPRFTPIPRRPTGRGSSPHRRRARGRQRWHVFCHGRPVMTRAHRTPPDYKIACRSEIAWSAGDSAGCGWVPPVGVEPTL